MEKISFRAAVPMILAGIFAVVVFIAMIPAGFDPNFYITIFFLLVFIFFYGLYVGQTVAAPIENILRRAMDLTKGDLKSRFYLDSKDEFGELAKIFNKIADDLEASRVAADTLEKSVGIKVKAKTKNLEEIINALEQKVKNRTIEVERLLKDSERQQDRAKSAETGNADVNDDSNESIVVLPPKKEEAEKGEENS